MKNTKLLLGGGATIITGIGLSFYNTNFAVLCAIGLMMVGVAIMFYLEEHEE